VAHPYKCQRKKKDAESSLHWKMLNNIKKKVAPPTLRTHRAQVITDFSQG